MPDRIANAQRPEAKLPPTVRADVQRILDTAARRLLAEKLDGENGDRPLAARG